MRKILYIYILYILYNFNYSIMFIIKNSFSYKCTLLYKLLLYKLYCIKIYKYIIKSYT